MNEVKKFLEAKPCKFNLRFSPYAWAKLLYLRDIGDTEVGMYGITPTKDPMLITDVRLVKQECTSVTVELDTDDSVAFVERMLDEGLAPWQCQNIWIHTHPGNCPEPSGTDEENFTKNFSHPHWAIFFILAKGGQTWCEAQFNVGPTCRVVVEYSIAYNSNFQGANKEAWQEEYKKNVTEQKWNFKNTKTPLWNKSILGETSVNDGLFASMERAMDDLPNQAMNMDAWLNECGFDDKDIMAYDEYLFNDTSLNEKSIPDEERYRSQQDDQDMYWEDDKVWFWDVESDEFYMYDPKKDRFYVHSSGKLYRPRKGEKWADEVRAFAKKGNKKIITTV